MKKTLRLISALAITVMCAVAFTACGGGGDSGSGGSSGSSGGGNSYIDYNDYVVGFWTGKGTNIDGEVLNIHVTFNSDRTGRVVMSTPNRIIGADIKNWYAYEKEIRVPSDKFDYPLIWKVKSGSIVSGSIVVETQGGDGAYWGTVPLTREEGGGGSDPSDEEVTTPVRVTATVIKWVKTSSGSSYSRSTATCYKKSSGSHLGLYSNSSCTSLIGYASSNSLSTWGGYSVGSYDYMVRYNVTSSHSTYYFFD